MNAECIYRTKELESDPDSTHFAGMRRDAVAAMPGLKNRNQ